MEAHAEAARGPIAIKPLRGRFGWLIQILCLVYAALVVVEDGAQYLWPKSPTAQVGFVGASFAAERPGEGIVVVESVIPGGAMARAGVVAGDRVRFDRPYDFFRRKQAGEKIGFTLMHATRTSHAVVTAEASKPQPMTGVDRLAVVYGLSSSMAALFGAFIIWRSRRNTTTLLLGMALTTYGLVLNTPQLWLMSPSVFPFTYVVGAANGWVAPIFFYAFASRFYHDCVRPAKRYETVAFWVYALAAVVAGAVNSVALWEALVFPVIGDGSLLGIAIFYLGLSICVAYLFMGWRRSTAAVQQRYALMLIATAAIILSGALDIVTFWTRSDTVRIAHYLISSLLTGVIASGLFAYAILRQRVFDLGFAVNRTLVYAVVSAILLAAFGLIEWAVAHFIPIQGREKNALMDAVIAVAVFLTFHRVRDFVEHAVERLFFRSWQKAEATLRQFVRESVFITETPALTRAFVQALRQFGDGAETAIYLKEPGGYRRRAGAIDGVAELLDADLPDFVSARADPKPREVSDSALAAALIAPMVNRNEVVGVVLLGPKPSGLGFRPDEVDLIGWATHEVGQDLQAREVERFVSIAAALRDDAEILRRENETLRSLIPQGA